ncbi:MAG: hypothetical protein NTY42_17135 [Planctomycetota bacterium]|nr:hypothetical protein [Planctomycetota bacterium]
MSRFCFGTGILLCGLVVAGGAAAAWCFSATQSVWIDETTQLSGLTLDPLAQTRWLAGLEKFDHGVPDDRMPPLSYWLGSLWSRVFGLTEGAMRAFGIACVTSGFVAAFLATLRITAGQACPGSACVSAGAAAALVGLNPNTVSLAGEIRAYPLFLMLACWGALAMCGLVLAETDSQRKRWSLGLALACILASYTHFYGLPMGVAVWAAVLGHRRFNRRPLGVELVGACSMALSSGLVPFALASLRMSPSGGPAAPAEIARDAVRLAFRIIVHPAAVTWELALGLLLLGGFAAVWAGIARVISFALVSPRRVQHDSEPCRGSLTGAMAAVVVGGLAMPIVIAVISPGFDALSPSYNVWLLPFFVLFLVSCLNGAGKVAVVSRFGVATLVSGSLIATALLLHYRSLYSHGPAEFVRDQVISLVGNKPSEPVAIIHDAEGMWGFAYFPLVYQSRTGGLSGARLEQYLLDDQGRVSVLGPDGITAIEAPTPWTGRSQLWLHTRSLGSDELRTVARGGSLPVSLQSSPWPQGEPRIFNAFARAEVHAIPVDPVPSLQAAQR